jgi:hypothetical protein
VLIGWEVGTRTDQDGVDEAVEPLDLLGDRPEVPRAARVRGEPAPEQGCG